MSLTFGLISNTIMLAITAVTYTFIYATLLLLLLVISIPILMTNNWKIIIPWIILTILITAVLEILVLQEFTHAITRIVTGRIIS